MHHAHAATAAASRRLDDDRVADLLRKAQRFFIIVVEGAIGTGHAGHAGCFHCLDSRDLVPHHADGVRPGPDENKTGIFDALREIGILREEAVSRMDRNGVGDLCSADDVGDLQIALGRGRWADTDRFVSKQDMLEVAVGLGMHGNGLDTELAACALDTQGDFATVGDEDLGQHLMPRLFDDEQRLVVLDGLAVFDQYPGDLAGGVCLDLVEDFHRLDNAESLTARDSVSHLDERLGAG